MFKIETDFDTIYPRKPQRVLPIIRSKKVCTLPYGRGVSITQKTSLIFIARKSRSYLISVSCVMRKKDFPKETPHLDTILEKAPAILANDGSCIAGPEGEWILAPDSTTDVNSYHSLDFNRMYKERQNFDPVGHYSRPDVTSLRVHSARQSTVKFQ